MTGVDDDGIVHDVWVPSEPGTTAGETRCGLLFRWRINGVPQPLHTELPLLVNRNNREPVTCIGCIGSDKPEFNPWP